MTVLVFPQMPGLTWPVDREIGNFDTTTQTAMSGKKAIFANRTQAQYRYMLTVEALDWAGGRPNLTTNSAQTLLGFYNQVLGGGLIFNFWDIDDNAAAAQNFGTGDGTTVAFQLARAIGGWSDNVFAPLAPSALTLIPNASAPNNAASNIYAPNNLLTYSNTFSNAIWTRVNSPAITSGVADPFGGTNASTITSTGASLIFQQVTGNSSTNYISMFWVRRRTGTGQVVIGAPNGAGSVTAVLTSTWTQFFSIGPGGTNFARSTVQVAVSGDAIDIYAPTLSAVTTETAPRPGDQVITTVAAFFGAPQIFVAGVFQDPSTYTLGATGVITFGSAPSALAALTWTGNYYWPCNFEDDSITMSKFMQGLYETKSLKFTTRVF